MWFVFLISACVLNLFKYSRTAEGVKASIYPLSVTLEVSKQVDLNVTATGYGSFVYDWYHNNSELIDVGRNDSVLRINNISVEDAGSYYCQVCNEDFSCYNTTAVYVTVTGYIFC